jgi:hypothetical protein
MRQGMARRIANVSAGRILVPAALLQNGCRARVAPWALSGRERIRIGVF